MPEEFQKKRGRDKLVYISVVVIILLVIFSLFALKQSKKGEELSGAVASALQGSEGSNGAGGEGATTSTIKSSATTTFKPVVLATPSDIIKAIVELRQQSNANEFIEVARLVTYLDDQFTAGNIDPGSWQPVLNCVYDKCTDSEYASLIDDYVRQNPSNNKFKLTSQIVNLYNLWYGRNIIQLSKDITTVDGMVTAMNNAKVSEKWKAISSCKITGTSCSDFPDKIFDMILAINAA